MQDGKQRLCWSFLLLLFVYVAALPACRADSISFTGSLDPNNPDSSAVLRFLTTDTSTVTIESWSYGGGVNAAGVTIPSGGFAPNVTLFGPGPAFLAIADNFLEGTPKCSVVDPNLACNDFIMTLDLGPGDYALLLTVAPNFASGTLFDPVFRGGGAYDIGSTSFYAIDVSGTGVTAVPEPSTLLLLALALPWLVRKRRV